MKSIKIILIIISALLSNNFLHAQIKNTQTATVKVDGNCDMCKATIEKAGTQKNSAAINWNKDTKIATLTYDAQKTSASEILKNVALAGYDNEQYLTPDEAYAKLPACCQYNRTLKPVSKSNPVTQDAAVSHNTSTATTNEKHPLALVFTHYFEIKDALIQNDGNTTAKAATALLKAIQNVDMKALTADADQIWMQQLKDLTANTEKIAQAKEVPQQRQAFVALSKNAYALAKINTAGNTFYYQYCPMYNNGKGAHWLSKSQEIKNPYYGAQMLTCGSNLETIR